MALSEHGKASRKLLTFSKVVQFSLQMPTLPELRRSSVAFSSIFHQPHKHDLKSFKYMRNKNKIKAFYN